MTHSVKNQQITKSTRKNKPGGKDKVIKNFQAEQDKAEMSTKHPKS